MIGVWVPRVARCNWSKFAQNKSKPKLKTENRNQKSWDFLGTQSPIIFSWDQFGFRKILSEFWFQCFCFGAMFTHANAWTVHNHHTNHLFLTKTKHQSTKNNQNHKNATACFLEPKSWAPFFEMEEPAPTEVLQVPTWGRPLWSWRPYAWGRSQA